MKTAATPAGQNAATFQGQECTLDFGNSKTEHFWLCGQFGLEIDPLYKNFKTESNNEHILPLPPDILYPTVLQIHSVPKNKLDF